MRRDLAGAVALLAALSCGDDGGGQAWEATGEETTGSTTAEPTTTSTTTTDTTGTTDTTTTGTTTDDASTGTTGEPDIPDSVFSSIAGGEFAPVAMGMGIVGRAQLLRAVTGLSTVEVAVGGLTAATAYDIDVHRLPCGLQDGGNRYLVDPDAANNDANRVHLNLTADDDGFARGAITLDHLVRGDGLSVIVHDPMDDAKIGCADLEVDPVDPIQYEGSLSFFAAAETEDETIMGDVALEVSGGTTTLTAMATGLIEASTYETNVHVLPCDGNAAGGEYERDPAGPANEDNQLWLSLVPDETGAAMDTLMVADHAARPDGQTLVINRVETVMMMTERPKVACADLVRLSWPDVLTTRGDVTTLQVGVDRGFDIGGTASMIRNDTGVTTVSVSLSGLSADTIHPVLVHDQPCASGGAAYAVNPGIAEMLQSNELWLLAEADTAGEAEVSESFDHLARADAMSLVVRDPTDGVVLACADLTRP